MNKISIIGDKHDTKFYWWTFDNGHLYLSEALKKHESMDIGITFLTGSETLIKAPSYV